MNRFPKTTTKNVDERALIDEMAQRSQHSEKVFDWRDEEFVRMGFANYVASFLASTRIDLHEMETLLNRGCPHDIACQILMGTMWSGEDEHWMWSDESEFVKTLDSAVEELELEPAV